MSYSDSNYSDTNMRRVPKYGFLLSVAAVATWPASAWGQQGEPVVNDAQEIIDARENELKEREALKPQREEPVLPVEADNAPAPALPKGSGEQSFRVGAILIDGAPQLDQSVFAGTIEPMIGRELSREDLADLTQQIAEIARDNGYVFASAYIPRQQMELGILRVTLDTGVIDEVRIVGSDNIEVRELLERLVGRNVTRDFVERQILLANDIPKVRVGKTAFLREDGKRILQVNLRDVKNSHRLSADNYGSNSFGPVRARLGFEFRGLLDDADIARIAVRTVPTDPKEILSASVNYETSVGTSGTRIGIAASASDTEPGGRREGSGIKGDSQYVRVYASHPLARSADASLWLTTNATYLSIEQTQLDTLLQQDNQVTFSVGLSSNIKLWGGRLRSGAELTQGVDIFGATRFGNPLASRSDGDAVFTIGQFYTNWTGNVAENLSLRVAVNGQLASRPLLAAQEVSLGGAYSARGYDFSESSGDNGIIGLVEIRRDFNDAISFLDRMQLYAFLDGGHVGNLRDGFGSGTLMSAGGGVRASAGVLGFELESAFPITEDRFDSGDKSPKLNLQVGINF